MIRGSDGFHVHTDPTNPDLSAAKPDAKRNVAPTPTDSTIPHKPAHDLTKLSQTEINALTRGGSDVNHVRQNLIAANGGSRIFSPDHFSSLLANLDTRTFEQKNFKTLLGGKNHPQQQLIDSLDKLSTEALTNKRAIKAGTFPETGLISSQKRAQRLNTAGEDTASITRWKGFLHQRLVSGKPSDVDDLLKLGADPTEVFQGKTPLQIAFGDGSKPNLEAFEKMLTHSGMMNQSLLNAPLIDGKNALHLAVEQGNARAVQWLLERGASRGVKTIPEKPAESMMRGLARVVTRRAAPEAEVGESPIDIANKLAAGEAKTRILALLGQAVDTIHNEPVLEGEAVVLPVSSSEGSNSSGAATPVKIPTREPTPAIVPEDTDEPAGDVSGVVTNLSFGSSQSSHRASPVDPETFNAPDIAFTEGSRPQSPVGRSSTPPTFSFGDDKVVGGDEEFNNIFAQFTDAARRPKTPSRQASPVAGFIKHDEDDDVSRRSSRSPTPAERRSPTPVTETTVTPEEAAKAAKALRKAETRAFFEANNMPYSESDEDE